MTDFDPNDELFGDPSDDGGDGRSEFPFEMPDEDPFELDLTGDEAATGTDAHKSEPAVEEDASFVAIEDDGSYEIRAEEAVPVAAPGTAAAAPSRSKRRKDPGRRGGTALGIHITSNTIYGTLLQSTADGVRAMRRFSRQRNAGGFDGPLGGDVADTVDSGYSDNVAIQFGEADEPTDSLFMGSEFGELANLAEMDDAKGAARRGALPFVFELKDLLDECAAIGHEKPNTAFCVGKPIVEYVELQVPEERGRKEDRARAGARTDAKNGASQAKNGASRAKNGAEADERPTFKTDRLLARLAEVYDRPFEKERVGFVPMTSREGMRRFLAIVPTPEDALSESLDLLREQSGMRSMPLRAADAEVPVLVGLTRWAFPAEPHENTAIVRVDSENTLVILLQGSELHHQEHMLSVTTVDGPDTICSRVLLQQDVQGVGTVHQVVVLSEEREDELVDGFAAFYPDARVAALRRGLIAQGLTPPPGQEMLSARALPATGVALRMLLERQKDSPFEQVNMLPKRLRRSRPKLDLFISWHTLVTGILLFFTVLFFVGLFFAQKAQISEARTAMAAYPAEAAMSPQALQGQIDSLRLVSHQVTQTLNTIDSLLVGSDRWTRTMTRLSRASTSAGGAWVEQWSPQSDGLQLSGYTVTRDQAVQFAERLNGSINSLSFNEIRSFPVFSFVVTVPVPHELPEVAQYLRDQAGQQTATTADPLGGALSAEEGGTASSGL